MWLGTVFYHCGCVHYVSNDDRLLIISLLIGSGIAVVLVAVAAVYFTHVRKKGSAQQPNETERLDRSISNSDNPQYDRELYIRPENAVPYSRRLPSKYPHPSYYPYRGYYR